MSGADTPQGPGWWQASDGKWYAPDQVSATPPTSTPTPTPPPMSPSSASQPGKPGGPGFFGRLFDVSMKSFITPSIVKVLFIIGIIVISLVSLGILIAGTQSDGGGFLIVLAPLYWFVGVLYLRVVLEVIIVLFRIEENTRDRR
jgi:hypothetical protein